MLTRKQIPLLALISKEGNDKHNPGEPLHHARGKSMDHGDCLLRHLMDLQDHLAAGRIEEAVKEADAVAWRALARSQELHEANGAPLAPGAHPIRSTAGIVGTDCVTVRSS